MSAMFGHTWVSQYGANPAGLGADTWGGVLAGITGAQLAEGMRATAALGKDWPPSAPRFRALCLGIPSLATVKAQIHDRNSIRSPFARLTYSLILDQFRFRLVDSDKSDRMLAEAYERASEHVMRGGALPVDRVELAAPVKPEHKPASPDVAKSHMSDIAKTLGDEPEAA